MLIMFGGFFFPFSESLFPCRGADSCQTCVVLLLNMSQEPCTLSHPCASVYVTALSPRKGNSLRSARTQNFSPWFLYFLFCIYPREPSTKGNVPVRLVAVSAEGRCARARLQSRRWKPGATAPHRSPRSHASTSLSRSACQSQAGTGN